VNTETVSREKKKDYQRFTLNPGNEGSKHRRQSTGGCVRLAPATSSQDFNVASFFWATMVIARVSTCRTQQVWRKEWMQRLCSGLGYKHLRNFSWSSFISTWLLIKYKFIPTHIKHKVRNTPWEHGKHNQRTRFKSIFKFDYHVRVQATLDREHG
jgi:hypothetical protein